MTGDPAAERQVPFYCPYCGDEALRPAGAQDGRWDCTSCARSFQLRFLGVLPPGRQSLRERADGEAGGESARASRQALAGRPAAPPGRQGEVRGRAGAESPDGAMKEPRRRAGSVALVGGGPGDPGLITVLGQRLLAGADVVVADKLAPRALLAQLGPAVEVIDAGKSPRAHNLTQDQINALIVDRARAGSLVVRLKGGDPYVFGRGGEEALACVRAGVPFQVVPGVTSAVAVPAYAGIPVTHRGVTQDFAVVSAHLDPAAPGATADWDALAHGPGTLVLLMAVAHLDRVAAELVRRGRPALTPVAVIQDGTTPRQRVLTSTLEQVAADAASQGVTPPAVVVIGEVVRLRDELVHLHRQLVAA